MQQMQRTICTHFTLILRQQPSRNNVEYTQNTEYGIPKKENYNIYKTIIGNYMQAEMFRIKTGVRQG